MNELTNPLDQVWYLSEDLDLDEAVSQMFHAASICPEIYLGFDEKMLSVSRTIAGVCRLLGLKGPLLEVYGVGNVVGIKTGIRFIFKPVDTAASIRERL